MENSTIRTACLIIVAVLLVACTRDRPTPEVVATADSLDVPVTAEVVTKEPSVVELTPDATSESDGDPQQADVTETPDPEEAPEIFQYSVQSGDTITTIAEKFETTPDIVRQLNFLPDDNIFAGQQLDIPYQPGMTAEGAPTPTPAPLTYEVQPGDTLGSIAIQFGVDPINLVETNNILQPDSLSVGTQLLIPGAQAAPIAEQGDDTVPAAGTGSTAGTVAVTHVVQPGESLLSIAVEYDVDPSDIALANNLANRNILRVGQELAIPGVTAQEAAATRGTIHIVQSGESLLAIALLYDIEVKELIAANEIDDANSIRVGLELIIPE